MEQIEVEIPESDVDVNVLEKECELAQDRLREQRETLREFSNEGLRVIRILLLFTAAPAAIVGALNFEALRNTYTYLQGDAAVLNLWAFTLSANQVFLLGLMALVLTAICHIIASGFEARAIGNISNPNDAFLPLAEGFDETEYYRDKLGKYVVRIDHNDKVIAAIEQYLGLGKFGMTLTVVAFLTLIYNLFTERPVSALWWFAALGVLVFYMKDLPKAYITGDRSPSSGPIYNTEYREYISEGSEKDD